MTKARFCPELEDLKAEDFDEMCDATRKFYSMQYSLIINILIVFLGAVGFFVTAVFIVKDKERVERYVAGKQILTKSEQFIEIIATYLSFQ